MTVVSINPTTGETLETFAETTPAALERVLDEAVAAYQTWRRCSYAHRAKLVREAARLLRERKSQHARTMALEMGKPLPQGEAAYPSRVPSCARADRKSTRLNSSHSQISEAVFC